MSKSDRDVPESADRRTYLSLVGSATLGTAVASDTTRADTATETPAGGCEELEGLESRIEATRERIAEREASLEAIRRERYALESEVVRARREVRDGLVRFPESVRAEARRTGEGIRDSVVKISGITGWFVTENVVATIKYPVQQQESGTATLHDASTVDWERIGTSESKDLGLVRVDGTVSGSPLPRRDPGDLSAGDKLVQVTHHPKYGSWLVTLGEFIERTAFRGREYLVSDVPLVGGSHITQGSPVVTMDGEVVGMTVYGGHFREELPAYYEREVYPVPLPGGRRARHLVPAEIRNRLEAWR